MSSDACPWEAMLDVACEAMVIRRADGTVAAWNEAATRLYGYQKFQAIDAHGDTLLCSTPPLQFPQRQSPGVWNALITRRRSDGREVDVEARLSALYDDKGGIAHILEASREARGDGSDARVREQYQALFHEMPIALCSVNSDAIGPYYASLGINDRTDSEAYFRDHPEVVQRAGELCYFEDVNARCVEILGAESPADLLGKPVIFAFSTTPESYRKILCAGLLGIKVEQETRLTGLDGHVRDVLLSCIRYQDGRRRSTLAGIIDIGGRLRAEAECHRIGEHHARALRRSYLGEAFTMFAHEMSQPISAIATGGQSGLHWLEKSPPDFGRIRASLEHNIASAMRAGDVIDRIRQLADSGEPMLLSTTLPGLVANAIRIVESRARSERIRIEVCDFTRAHRVEVDEIRVEQAIANILVNAIEAISRTVCEMRIVRISMTNAFDTVLCTIADSGPGFAKAQIEGVFRRGIARMSGEQTFGLPLCKAIIEVHDGHISASNHSPLGGAQLKFRLPAHVRGTDGASTNP